MRALTVCAMVASSLVGQACGDDGPPPNVFQATLDQATEAFEDRNARKLCSLLSAPAKEVIGYSGHAFPDLCPGDIPPYFEWMKPHESDQGPVVLRTSRDGRRARSVVKLPSGVTVTLPFVRESGRWKVDGLFDATLARLQLGETDRQRERGLRFVATVPAATTAASSVTVSDGKGKGASCPPVDTRAFPTLSGGCVLELSARRFGMSAVGPFGVTPFPRCGISYDLRIGGDGEAWIEDFLLERCRDITACWDKSGDVIPWRGRLDADGGGRILVKIDEVCLDTCMGRFVGDWQIELVREDGAWRQRVDQAMVGKTGWRFDGELDATGDDVEIAAGRSS